MVPISIFVGQGWTRIACNQKIPLITVVSKSRPLSQIERWLKS